MDNRFIVDSNVGKLAKWLRMMGYDTLFLNDVDDAELIRIAQVEGRTLLTKDTQIMKRRVVTSGRLPIVLIDRDEPKEQLLQVMKKLHLDFQQRQFTRCLECNEVLVPRERDRVKDLVPPYVFQTQTQYMQCPDCQRTYWRGTHWLRMKTELERLERTL